MSQTQQLTPAHQRSHAVVLCATDDAELRQTLAQQLAENYELSFCGGEDVLARSTAVRPAAIIVQGENLSARVLDQIRSEPAHAGTALLMTQPPAKPEQAEPEADVDGYIAVPIQRTVLLSTLRNAIELKSLRAAARNPLLDNFSESFISIDQHWRITHMNSAAEEFLNLNRDELLGKNLWDLPLARNSPRAHLYRRAMCERREMKQEGVDPRFGWFEIRVVPLDDGGLGAYFRSATRLKEAEAAARASEWRLRLFLEHARDYALILLDVDGRVEEWMGEAEEITGWASEDVVGKPIDQLYSAEDLASQLPQRERERAARDGHSSDSRWQLRKNGEPFFAEGVTTAFFDSRGELRGYGKLFRDATRQQLAREELRRNQEQLALIVNSVADGIYTQLPDGTCTIINPAGAAMLGYSPEELIGGSLHNRIHHHHADGRPYPAESCPILQAARSGARVSVDHEVFWHRDGRPVWVRYSVTPLIEGDAHCGAVVVFTDVSDKKRAEIVLRDSERRLRFVMDSIPQKIFTATADGDVIYYNPAWASFSGIRVEDLRRKGWQQLIHPDDLAANIRTWQHCLATAAPLQFEHRFRNARGEYRWHLSRAMPLRDENGELSMWVGSSTDIHDLKQVEVELGERLQFQQRHVELLAAMASASRAINAVLSVQGICAVLEQQAQRILEAERVTVRLLQGDESAPAPDAVENGCEHSNADCLHAALLGHHQRQLGAVEVWKQQGEQFSEEDEAILNQLASIAAAGLENAALYDSLREQDSRKDEFLATLAHELRNPLAPLRTGLDLLAASDTSERDRKVQEMMGRQLAHMVRLVDDLMDVSRVSRGKVELRREPTLVRTIFDTAVEATMPVIEAAQHQLIRRDSDKKLCVSGDLTRLAQVVSNLLNNAAKYTPAGGRIELSSQREDGSVLIQVRDTGIGMTADLLPKVFDLFTQAAPGMAQSQGGLGIGLSLVQKLVAMHGGEVWAQSPGPGQGSTFSLRLPLANEGEDSDELSTAEHCPDLAAKRVLVVDDNLDAAEVLAMLLEMNGHQVAVASDGPQAINKAISYEPDIVFLDIGLPGMNGYEVAAALRGEAKLRGTILIALTGWGSDEDRRRSREAGFDMHLTKPVEASTVATALASFCTRRPAPAHKPNKPAKPD